MINFDHLQGEIHMLEAILRADPSIPELEIILQRKLKLQTEIIEENKATCSQ
jgi:hypothetical protein